MTQLPYHDAKTLGVVGTLRHLRRTRCISEGVSTDVADVQRGASETGHASSQVLSAARSLAADSASLKQKVGSFLTSVRAA